MACPNLEKGKTYRVLRPGARLMRPIVFATFTRDPQPVLRGLRLYVECDLAAATRPAGREELVGGSGRWEDVVRAALRELGGRARLPEIYAAMLGRRPTDNRHWQEKIRQVLQRGPFRNIDRGEWALIA